MVTLDEMANVNGRFEVLQKDCKMWESVDWDQNLIWVAILIFFKNCLPKTWQKIFTCKMHQNFKI